MKNKFDSQKLINKYADMIYNIALRYLRNKDDAEDIVQDVFIQYINYIKKKGKFSDDEYEKCWLIRVTINLCNNEIKSARHKRNVPLEECQLMECNLNNNIDINESISCLTDKYRDVFELFYIEDMKISEISKVLSISETNVKTRLERAREKLRKILKRGGETENG